MSDGLELALRFGVDMYLDEDSAIQLGLLVNKQLMTIMGDWARNTLWIRAFDVPADYIEINRLAGDPDPKPELWREFRSMWRTMYEQHLFGIFYTYLARTPTIAPDGTRYNNIVVRVMTTELGPRRVYCTPYDAFKTRSIHIFAECLDAYHPIWSIYRVHWRDMCIHRPVELFYALQDTMYTEGDDRDSDIDREEYVERGVMRWIDPNPELRALLRMASDAKDNR